MVPKDEEEDVGSGQGEQDFREAEGGGGGEVRYRPLKGADFYAKELYYGKGDGDRIKVFKAENVKSAVQGLLRDIEEDVKYWEKEMKEYEEKSLSAKTEEERKEYDKYWEIAEQVHRILEKRIKNLIKKWFADVVEEDN